MPFNGVERLNIFRVIVSFHLTFLIPISMVTENMKRSQRRNAVLEQKLLFRKGLATCNTPPECTKFAACRTPSAEVVEMTVSEIINGLLLRFGGYFSCPDGNMTSKRRN